MGSGIATPHCKEPGPLMQSRAVNAHDLTIRDQHRRMPQLRT